MGGEERKGRGGERGTAPVEVGRYVPLTCCKRGAHPIHNGTATVSVRARTTGGASHGLSI